jgi:hypothetical protein
LGKDLEKPITACGLEFDEENDHVYENSLDQYRRGLHLHIGILEPGADMTEHLEKLHTENYYAAGTVWGKYNIQQAVISNGDGTAGLAVTRYTNFEDDGENDFEYMGVLVCTDGSSVSSTDLLYSIDKEYGDGERAEATIRALTAYYGIDYDMLEWTDMDSKPGKDEVVFEEKEMLTWADKDMTYGPVRTFYLALTSNQGTSIRTTHDTGVTILYELTDSVSSAEELLKQDIEGAERLAETIEEGSGFSSSSIRTAPDGSVVCSYSYTDEDGNTIRGIFAYQDTDTEGIRLRTWIHEDPVWGYSEGEDKIFDRVISEFGYTD